MKFSKKHLSWVFLSTLALVPFSALACSSSSNAPLASGTKVAKVIFRTSQSKVFPLVQALKKLIPYYNQKFQKTKDFLPVEFVTSEENAAFSSESALTNQSVNDFETLLQNPHADITLGNILLANPTSAYAINAYQRILETKNSKLNLNLLNPQILKGRNLLSGSQAIKGNYFSLPFNITNQDSLVFNLEIMHQIVLLIEEGGGKVDRQSLLYQKILEAAKIGVGNALPLNKGWANTIVKSPSSLKNVFLSDDTFSNLENIFNFSKLLYQGIKVNPQNITDPSSITIFAIDYQDALFKKQLGSILSQKSDHFNFLWSLKTAAANSLDSQVINFDFLENQQMQEEFLNLFDFYQEHLLQREVNQIALNKQYLKAVEFMSNKNQWASWKIRTFDSAFALAANVGVNQSIDSALSRKFFLGPNSEQKKAAQNWAAYEDVFWKKQIFQNSKKDASVYHEGGSSLILLKTNDFKRDQATLKFVEWLYFGKINLDEMHPEERRIFSSDTHGVISLAQAILELSGYVLPTKEILQASFLEEVKKTIKSLNLQLQNLSREGESKNLYEDLEAKRNAYQAAQGTLEDLLVFTNPEKKIFSTETYDDQKALKIISEINNNLWQRTNDQAKQNISSEETLEAIKRIARRKR